jgi:hypothetical protein
MSDIKPIGFKPDGSHISKGAIAIVICILIGTYCIFSEAPFGTPKVDHKMTITKDMGDK